MVVINTNFYKDEEKKINLADIDFKKIYIKSVYTTTTQDGWQLYITRYKPIKQNFDQPLFNLPLLLVHGFSQNRLTWTSGEFVRNMIFFGADIHILELRGHGRSSIEAQYKNHLINGVSVPKDIDYDWDVDSYLMYDIPAGVKVVKDITGHKKIFYCGHSMGGMLGYCYSGIAQEDLYGMITIGAPAELGRGISLIKLASFLMPFSSISVLAFIKYMNLNMKGKQTIQHINRIIKSAITKKKNLTVDNYKTFNLKFIPIDDIFVQMAKIAKKQENLIRKLPDQFPKLWNPEKVKLEDLIYLLENGAEKEPIKVLEEFAKWTRHNELKIYKIGLDCIKNFEKIKIPLAIFFGDQDIFANITTTKGIYRKASSDYLLWRPVRGNSHIELTMGADIKQISFDIKNLMEYAIKHNKD